MEKIHVYTSKHYEIEIERGIVLNNSLPEGLVVTDSNIFRKYGNLIKQNEFIVIKAGEKSKSLKNYQKIVGNIGENKTIIAVSGGVIGDLAGFAASTYKRGIGLVQVPTSLLAMVDSSIGGKNGINLSQRKNYLGNIYQPDKVLIDPLFLRTLPNKELANGLAEIIKYAAIFDDNLLERLQKPVSLQDEDLEDIISRCCKIKSRVVETDEQDIGYRHTLNLGHTIGHAIELLYGLGHGEAISIGMVKEAKLASSLGLIKKEKTTAIINALKANNLPTNFPIGYDKEKVLELMKADKKGIFVFAFNRKYYDIEVNEREVKNSLE